MPKQAHTILIVEDDDSIREFLELFILAELKHCIYISTIDCEEATKRLKSVKPSVILLDWKLPGMVSSAEFVANIRRDYSNMKIILLTAADLQEIDQASFFKVIEKPFDIDELLQALNKALDSFNQTDAQV